jgi:hypothetical protein
MITVEDLILHLAYSPGIVVNAWDQKIIYSFADQISQNSGFTEKQAALAVKILKRHKKQLDNELKLYIGDFFENPQYKFPIRTINNSKKISIISTDHREKSIKVEFPYNETYINHIRQNKDRLDLAVWDKEEKSWIFSLSENNLKFLMDLSVKENFIVDKEFQNYCDQILEVIKNIENYIPMLTMENNQLKFKNISENIPKLNTNDLIEALFEARKYGITTLDDSVCTLLDNINIPDVVKDFLKTDPSENYHLNSEKYAISELTFFVKYLNPCLFIIPGGAELVELKRSLNFLNSLEIPNEHISVMFRLPSETDKEFNDFVKNSNLNSPLDENTKIVFISGKLPKPVLSSKIHFNSIINLGFKNAHYGIKNYILTHENSISFTKEIPQREFNFEIV